MPRRSHFVPTCSIFRSWIAAWRSAWVRPQRRRRFASDATEKLESRLVQSAVMAVGGEFKVSNTVTGNATSATAASDAAGNTVVAWRGYTDHYDAHVRLYNSAGVAVGSEFIANQARDVERVSVAMSSQGSFVVLWEGYGPSPSTQQIVPGLFAQRYSAAGVAQGAEIQVAAVPFTFSIDWVTAAMDKQGDFAVAWHLYGGNGIAMRTFNANGVALQPAFTPKSGTHAHAASIAMDDVGNSTITYSVDPGTLYASRYSLAGAALGSEFVVSPASSSWYTVAMSPGGSSVIAWGRQNGYLGVQRYDATGAKVGTEFEAAPIAASLGYNGIDASMNADGDFVLAWGRNYSNDVNVRGYNSAGAALGEGQVINMAQRVNAPDVALDAGGRTLVVWPGVDTGGNSIFGRRLKLQPSIDNPGPTQNFNSSSSSVTAPAVVVAASAIVHSPGNFFPQSKLTVTITNFDASDRLSLQSSGALVLSNGTLKYAGVAVGTVAGGNGRTPLTIVFNGSAQRAAIQAAVSHVTYANANPAASHTTRTIQFQFVDGKQRAADAVTKSVSWVNAPAVSPKGETHLNATTPQNGYIPAVANDAKGNSVVVWASDDTTGKFLHAQLIRFDGTPQGRDFVINQFAGIDVLGVAMDPQGNFVVAWEGGGPDPFTEGRVPGLYVQRFDAAGVPQGGALQVASVPFDFSIDSVSVAMDAKGDFALAWHLYGNSGVDVRTYSASGVPLTSVIHVHAGADTAKPALAMDAQGHFVVAYSYGNTNLYARRYNLDGTPQGAEFLVSSNRSSAYSVAMSPAGAFVIAWGDSSGQISYQRYSATGAKAGGLSAATTVANALGYSGIDATMDSAGAYAITWIAANNNNVFLRFFTATGAPRTDVQPINTTKATGAPSAAMNSDGTLAVTWNGQIGSTYGIYGRRFDTTGTFTAVAPFTRTAVDTLKITFSDAMRSVALSDFALNGTPLSTFSGLSLSHVGNAWTIQGLAAHTSTGSPSKTYAVSVLPGNGLIDVAGNSFIGAPSVSWVMDAVRPTGVWSSVVSPRNTALGSVTIKFSEAMQNVTLANFTFNGTKLSTLAGTSIVASAGNVYTINGLAGYTAAGSPAKVYAVAVPSSNTLRDAAGNALSGVPIVGWTMDTVRPTGVWASVVSPRNTALGSVTIKFSEAMQNVTLANFTLNGTKLSTLAGTSIVALAGNVYTINGLAAYTAAGSPAKVYAVAVPSSNTLRDAAGNALSGVPIVGWTMDMTIHASSEPAAAQNSNSVSERPSEPTPAIDWSILGRDLLELFAD